MVTAKNENENDKKAETKTKLCIQNGKRNLRFPMMVFEEYHINLVFYCILHPVIHDLNPAQRMYCAVRHVSHSTLTLSPLT
jgi:hypothetical protein